jgi:ubiquinone/menaquinone biosynthesis C-methylase UbiE
MGNEDRATYMKTRYRRSQMIVNWREQSIVAGMLGTVQRPLRKILDAPSGHGRFTPQLRPAATEKLICGDIVVDRLEALVNAEAADGAPIEVMELDLFKALPFEDCEFDLVFNFRFFQHVKKEELRDQLIQELARVSGRYVLVSFYEAAALHAWQKRHWKRSGHKRVMPMPSRGDFFAWFAAQGCRVLAHKGVIPGVHAQRIVLFEKS